MNITNPNFRWTPSGKTNVAETWRRHGWKPTSEAERRKRQVAKYGDPKGRVESESPDVPVATPAGKVALKIAGGKS